MPDASTQTRRGKKIFLLPQGRVPSPKTIARIRRDDWTAEEREELWDEYDAMGGGDDFDPWIDTLDKTTWREKWRKVCETCKKFINHDDEGMACGPGCPEYDEGWKETHSDDEEVRAGLRTNTITIDKDKVLYQYFKKEHIEKMWDIKFTDEKWEEFVERNQNSFAEIISNMVEEELQEELT